jgi:hypothetical protein
MVVSNSTIKDSKSIVVLGVDVGVGMIVGVTVAARAGVDVVILTGTDLHPRGNCAATIKPMKMTLHGFGILSL